MNKPASVAAHELYDTIIAAVEESRLPAFVVSSILYEITTEVKQLAVNQYNADVLAYQQALAEEQNTNEEKKDG